MGNPSSTNHNYWEGETVQVISEPVSEITIPTGDSLDKLGLNLLGPCFSSILLTLFLGKYMGHTFLPCFVYVFFLHSN